MRQCAKLDARNSFPKVSLNVFMRWLLNSNPGVKLSWPLVCVVLRGKAKHFQIGLSLRGGVEGGGERSKMVRNFYAWKIFNVEKIYTIFFLLLNVFYLFPFQILILFRVFFSILLFIFTFFFLRYFFWKFEKKFERNILEHQLMVKIVVFYCICKIKMLYFRVFT